MLGTTLIPAEEDSMLKVFFTVSKVVVLLPAMLASAVIEAGLPMSSVPAVVGAIAIGNATLAGMAPGATPQILEAAGKAYTAACVSSVYPLTFPLTFCSKDVESFRFGWYACIVSRFLNSPIYAPEHPHTALRFPGVRTVLVSRRSLDQAANEREPNIFRSLRDRNLICI